jgi:hypothetical protein
VRVSIAIQAHPARSRYVDDLVRHLGPVPIAWAREPFATREDTSPTWTSKREALLLHDDAPFHCVIQDDALLGRDFRPRLEALVEAGDYVYGLFYRHKPNRDDLRQRARRAGDHFMAPGFLLGVGVVVPTAWVEDLVAYGDRVGGTRGDDFRMKRWMAARGLETYVPLPSLVDHRPGPSIVGHNGDRVAWRFA